MKLLGLDVETSGLDGDNSEILELSYQSWDNGTRGQMFTDKFRAIGNTQHPDFLAAAKINGYKDTEREQCATFRAGFLVRCFEAIDACDGVIVGANPSFDYVRFLERTAKRYRVPLPKSRVRMIDVSSLAVPLFAMGKIEGLSLHQIAKFAGKTQSEVHSSVEDVTLALDSFEALCKAYCMAYAKGLV